ncbi:DTDP-4-dehydrorhamnose reductase [Candidatus Vecturithrix granuli]|uniref:dTDP-4-dehydrorhamnose reductase n=1 Tax=Vecturithrix granuli TaxID=1499967 RepID=A0A081C544_VECG1|nr:DTDP-4-dehydrorhamnose reductase [Candidatus Vecturithrix granuli]
MKILVTGAKGMLGTDLTALLQADHEVFGIDLHNCDILQAEQLRAFVQAYQPEVIIHTAAYTNVDQAEIDEERATQLNVTGAKNVATAARTCQAKMIYISTDYVFDGQKSVPYTEDDPTHPLGVYGKTKFLGEQEVRALLNHDRRQDFLIVRTAWLYGQHGKNFVKAILERVQQQQPLRVVNDQTGSPTYTCDLARGILALIEHKASGIVHLTNSGQCTWYDFAKTILAYRQLSDVKIEAITTAELQRPAPRPAFSVLDTSKFTALTGQTLRPWQEGLQAYFEE